MCILPLKHSSLANGKNKFAAITQLTTVKWRLQCKSCTSLHSFVPSKLLLLPYKCIETPVDLTKLVLKQTFFVWPRWSPFLF